AGGVQNDDGDDIDGKVTSRDGKIDCHAGDNDGCVGDFSAFAEVTLTADPEGEFDRWSGACQEAGESPTCTLLLSGDDVVGAKFDDADNGPNIIPPRQKATLIVSIEPAGAGRVTSSRSRFSEAIDCTTTCHAT